MATSDGDSAVSVEDKEECLANVAMLHNTRKETESQVTGSII